MSRHEEMIAGLNARVAELDAHCVRLGQGDAERYWEGRWRDAEAELYALKADYTEAAADSMELKRQLDALKAQPGGVVLPERKAMPVQSMFAGSPSAYAKAFDTSKAHNACLDEVARLNSSPVGAGEAVIDLDAAAWTQIKEAASQSAWMPEQYFMNDWVSDICAFLREPRTGTAPSHGEQVRHMVPSWMASARAFVDRLHLAGWRDHADAQHAGVAGMYDELLAAPSAGSQKEQGK